MSKEIVMVHWVDSTMVTSGELTAKNAQDLGPTQASALGFVLKDDSVCITLALTEFTYPDGEEPEYRQILSIPRCAITSVDLLTIADIGISA